MSVDCRVLVCTKCGEEKPITEFHNDSNKTHRYGKCCTCRTCNRKRDAEKKQDFHERYEKNKAYRLEYNKKRAKKLIQTNGWATFFFLVHFKDGDRLAVGEAKNFSRTKDLENKYLDQYTLLGVYTGKIRVAIKVKLDQYLLKNNRYWFEYSDDSKALLEEVLKEYEGRRISIPVGV